jgi:hypothetical protein
LQLPQIFLTEALTFIPTPNKDCSKEQIPAGYNFLPTYYLYSYFVFTPIIPLSLLGVGIH